jgi:hypothetical protein
MRESHMILYACGVITIGALHIRGIMKEFARDAIQIVSGG